VVAVYSPGIVQLQQQVASAVLLAQHWKVASLATARLAPSTAKCPIGAFGASAPNLVDLVVRMPDLEVFLWLLSMVVLLALQ
jgi:hypothetical protein